MEFSLLIGFIIGMVLGLALGFYLGFKKMVMKINNTFMKMGERIIKPKTLDC